jgi:hypothetical protein
MREWFVWEHKDNSGLEIGPRWLSPLGRGLEDHVESVVTMSGRGWANGHHVLTDEQRAQAQMIRRAVNARYYRRPE